MVLRGSTTLGYQHGFMKQPIPHTMVVTWALDIKTDPSCSRIMDPGMALVGSLGSDTTMPAGGSAGHSDQFASSSAACLTPGHLHNLRQQHRVEIQAALNGNMGHRHNTDPDCGRAVDPDMACGHPRPEHHYGLRWQHKPVWTPVVE